MKIVTRDQLMAMPAGTVFQNFEPRIFGEIRIKGDTCGSDFYLSDLDGTEYDSVKGDIASALLDATDRSLKTGENIKIVLNSECREGMFDKDQLYAVWNTEDVYALIARLQECLHVATPPKEPVWVIQSRADAEEFWNNELGWVDQEHATQFSVADTQQFLLPLEGVWTKGPQ